MSTVNFSLTDEQRAQAADAVYFGTLNNGDAGRLSDVIDLVQRLSSTEASLAVTRAIIRFHDVFQPQQAAHFTSKLMRALGDAS